MAFCEIADLAAFLQIEIADDSAAALAAIDEATAAIQGWCNQIIEQVEDDEYTFDTESGRTKLFLPELPVTEVSSVVENDEELDVDDDYKLGNNGVLHRMNGPWYAGVQSVVVTYTHGYEEIPQTIVDICTRAASRRYQAGLKAAALEGIPGVSAQTLGDYSVQYGSEQSGGSGSGGTLGASAAPVLLQSEKELLARYRVKGP